MAIFLPHERMQLSLGQNGLASLTPSFAVIKGDHKLLHQLLSSGVVDPNECDSNGRTALHLAASKGYYTAVFYLLYFGADPNRRDVGGSVPLWEAMLARSEYAIRGLIANDAILSSGDTGRYACMAAEQSNIYLLKEIIKYDFDVMQPRAEDGRTAIDIAAHQGNFEMFHLLLNREKGVLHINPDALKIFRLRPFDTDANDNTNANNEADANDDTNSNNEDDTNSNNEDDTNANNDGSTCGYELCYVICLTIIGLCYICLLIWSSCW